MKIEKPINSLSTYVVFDTVDFLDNPQKRYYAVPKDYRPEVDNPFQNEPTGFIAHDIDTPAAKAYEEAMRLMNHEYWRILADAAEENHRKHDS
jgi:hypothetical protein